MTEKKTDTAYVGEYAAAERYQVSVLTLRKWRLTGRGPRFRKFGSAVRYSLADLEAFEAAAVRTSTSDPGPDGGCKCATRSSRP